MNKLKVKYPILLGIAAFFMVGNIILMFTTDIEGLFDDYSAYRNFSNGIFMLFAGLGVLAMDMEDEQMVGVMVAVGMMVFGLVQIWSGLRDVISIGYIDINLAPNLPEATPGENATPIVPGG